jgi:hypothetical protein
MAKRRRTDNTIAKRSTDNTMAKRRRTDNTMAKRKMFVICHTVFISLLYRKNN